MVHMDRSKRPDPATLGKGEHRPFVADGSLAREPPRHSRRSLRLYLALVAALVAFALRELLEPDRIPLFRDTLFFFVPYKRLLAERIARGELPLWNPYIYMGTPFLGSLVSGALYPLSPLLALRPFPQAFNLFLLAHYLLGATGMWLLLRGMRLGPAAAAVGSLVFAIGGFVVSLMSLTNHLQGAAWAPWILFFWLRFCSTPALGPWLGLTISGSIQILAGAPEIGILTCCAILASTLYVAHIHGSASPRLLVGLATAGAFVAGLTALQTLPTLEYVANSGRQEALPLAEVTTWSLDPISLLQLLFPHSASLDPTGAHNGLGPMLERDPPWLASLYIGLIPLVLAITALITSPQRWLWGALACAGLGLALGRHAPLLPALYREFPALFGKFRYPEKFFFLVHVAAAVLAALGAEALFRGEPSAWRAARSATATLLAAATALFALRWLRPDLYLLAIAALSGSSRPITTVVPLAADLTFKAQRVMVILGTFVLLLVFHRRQVLRPSVFAVLVVSLSAADLVSAHQRLNPSTSWHQLLDQPELIDVGALRESHRRLFLYSTVENSLHGIEPSPVRGLEPLARGSLAAPTLEDMVRSLWRALYLDAPMIAAVETLSGNDGIARESDNALREQLRARPRAQTIKLLRTFSAEVLIGLQPLDGDGGLERVDAVPPSPFFVYRLEKPVPKAYLALRLRSASTDVDAFEEIVSADFEPGRDAVVATRPADWHDAPVDSNDAGHVALLRNHPEYLELEVEAPRQALLVLNDSYFPGWHARLDGTAVQVLRVNALVRGVLVPAGRHHVDFSYRPRSFWIGAVVSAGSFGLLIVLACSARYTSSAARPCARGFQWPS